MKSLPTMMLLAILGAAVIAGAAASTARGEETGTDDKIRKARVNIGVSIDYAWWNPVWGRVNQAGDILAYALLNQAAHFMKIEQRSRHYSVDPALLCGMRVDAGFLEKWDVSARLIVGPNYNASVMVTSLTTNPIVPSEYIKYGVNALTFDSSVLARYRFAPWFRLSFGPAYQGYTLRERNSSYLLTTSRKESVHLIGGKAGGTITIRLVENLFILPDITFQALYGFSAVASMFSRRKHPIAVGVDALMPLSYYAEKIHTSFSIGFRFQFLHYVQVSNEDDLNREDHRYGVTESITYAF